MIEPLSIKDINNYLKVSLRGSLAEQYCGLSDDEAQQNAFMFSLLNNRDPRIIKIVENGQLVIGMRDERGGYFPDW
ncbi:MAG: hypothetical protein V7725_04430 [Porticoccus sp.]